MNSGKTLQYQNILTQNFLGNNELKQTLSGNISVGRLFHAVLLEGESGCGKKTLAKLYAAGILCKHGGCGKCSSCRKVLSDSHPDVEIYGGGGARSFHIDTVRRIKRDAYISPNESDKKVMILSDVQDMTVQAQNALLKIFEEPPEHVVFILTCDNVSSLLPTIASRAVIYRVENLPHDICVNELCRRFESVTSDEASMYSRLFGGNLGECIKAAGNESYKKLIWNCIAFIKQCGANEYQLLKTSSLFGEKKELLTALRILKLLLSDIFVSSCGAGEVCCFDLQSEPDRLGSLQIMKIIDIIDSTRDMLSQNVNSALALSCMCAGIQEILVG